MTAITPLTTGYHEITPLTTKSERCYNPPPLYKIGKQPYFIVLNFKAGQLPVHRFGDFRKFWIFIKSARDRNSGL